jgi:hypothetical protein
LEDAQGGVAIAAGDQHRHLVGGDVAEADGGKAELRRDRGDDQPVAVDGGRPEVEEDRNLDELDDGSGQLAKPVGGKAKQEAALSLVVDGSSSARCGSF